mmetsp:Transcript_48224/g.95151  ORF Transcript_48224/g.95151 Transcript_48224/m.95151 type:complete len:184 (-) Transcript_48224:350-901(-)
MRHLSLLSCLCLALVQVKGFLKLVPSTPRSRPRLSTAEWGRTTLGALGGVTETEETGKHEGREQAHVPSRRAGLLSAALLSLATVSPLISAVGLGGRTPVSLEAFAAEEGGVPDEEQKRIARRKAREQAAKAEGGIGPKKFKGNRTGDLMKDVQGQLERREKESGRSVEDKRRAMCEKLGKGC